jgi:uncharacterized membrane protein YagU involved in acid resistance
MTAMLPSVGVILILLALVFVIVAAVYPRVPLWAAVLCLVLERLVALGVTR